MFAEVTGKKLAGREGAFCPLILNRVKVFFFYWYKVCSVKEINAL